MHSTLRCLTSSALIALLLHAAPAESATADLVQRLRTQYEPILDQAMKDHDIPGFVMAVVADGKTVYTLTRGVRSLDGEEALHERSLFHMASVTKPFVATAIMQLVEAGKVDLDQPVQRYLPYFRLKDPRGASITVRQMLSHTSGMPDVNDYEWEKAVDDEGALERFVRSLTDRELVAAPGERFQYSNMAFEVLGDLIAKVSGETFEGYVRAHIFAPLGMKDSTLLRSEANPKLTTSPHVLGDRLSPIVSPVYPYNRMHAPSSTLHSNLVDMSRWALANLRRGELDGRRILQASTYDVMWKPTGDPKRPVAISWFQGERGGHRTISHGGGDTGYRSNLLLLSDDGIAVVMMINFDSIPGAEIRDAATDVVLGVAPKRVPKSLGRTLGRTILDDGAGAAVKQYRELKTAAPEDYDFGEGVLNSLGYWLLRHDRTADAVEIFKLNVDAYPDRPNPHDSLGEVYRKLGQRDLALASYRKALELEPTSDSAKEAIKELEQERSTGH
jgi:CubicO group peptidase (beta-lactamase class C family)